MPVIGRDQIKEGYVHTLGQSHNELPEDANRIATDIFFDTLMGLISKNVSVIAEAAFQHQIWSTMLEPFMSKAQVYLILCKVDENIALKRFVQRELDNPLREYFYGDKDIDLARKGLRLEMINDLLTKSCLRPIYAYTRRRTYPKIDNIPYF